MKVGHRVRLIGTYTEDKYNPKDIEGTIVSITGDYNPILVLWDNGIRNSYVAKSLELV